MKLSKEQIDIIEKKLEDNNLCFLDYKIEIQDHIACNIEELMIKKQLSFEHAFEETFKKWEYKLKPHLTFLISNKKDFPKIVTRKLFYKFLYFNISLIISVFVGIFIFMNIQEKANNYLEIYKISNNIFSLLFTLSLVFLFIIFIINKSTTYSYRYKKHFPILLIYAIFNIFLNTPFISILSFFILIAVMPFLITTFFNHIKILRKYKAL